VDARDPGEKDPAPPAAPAASGPVGPVVTVAGGVAPEPSSNGVRPQTGADALGTGLGAPRTGADAPRTDPDAPRPKAASPKPGDDVPESGASKTSVPEPAAPKTSTPESGAPKTSTPESGAPKTSTSESGAPKTGTSESGAPKTSVPEPAAPKTSAPKAGAPKTGTPKSSGPKSGAPKTSAPQTSAPQTSAPGTGAAKSGVVLPRSGGPARPAAPARPGAARSGPDLLTSGGRPLTEPPAPPWTRVFGNTMRLWMQRRSRRARTLVILGVVLLVFAAGAITVLFANNPAGGPGAATRPGQPGSSSAIAAASAARRQAAAWVTAQVSRNAIVACDPATCDSLQAAGFPAGSIIQLEPSAGDPLGSAVVIATAALRSQIGARLTSVYAPVVLASFGTGAARVDVRVIAPDGSAQYLSELRADVQARITAGAALLSNSHVSMTAAARQQLAFGQVDMRLLITLASLAGQRDIPAVSIAGFSDSGPGASPGLPLRVAELASPPGSADAGRGYLNSVLAFVNAQRAPYLATSASLERLSGGQLGTRIEFAAPSPLGLLGSPQVNGRKS
jgi:hypothetical protein